jgi:outer membrane protein assembly factor BamB
VPTAVPTTAPTQAQALEPQATATSSLTFLLPAFTPIPQAQSNTQEPQAPQDSPAPAEVTIEITPAPESPDETAPAPTARAANTPAPTLMPALTAQAAPETDPAKLGVTEAAYRGSTKMTDYLREEPVNAQGGDGYAYFPAGVLTFRGDAMRRNAAFGSPDMPLDELTVLWKTPIGSLRTEDAGTLWGAGWTGQPAIVKWAREVRLAMNLSDAAKAKADPPLKEVIFAAQDGKIYFLDLSDGTPTRDPIVVGYPLKGSVSLDSNARPILAVGQGVSKLPGKQGPIGLYLYNLLDQSRLLFLNGRQTDDQLQYATNGAFDGTPLFDRISDTMVVAGENGLLYTIKLNAAFDFKDAKTLSVDPQITYLRGKTEKQADTSVSVEGSVAMYGPYAYYADKQGILRCVDTTAMKTAWAYDTGDNTDATVALDLENGADLALYTGTTVFNRTRKDGNAHIRRMDAMTGAVEWEYRVPAKYSDDERSGVSASPLVGDGAIADLVIFTVNGTPDGAEMVALDKQTGAAEWTMAIPGGAVSSPVAVYTKDGRARVVQAGLDGTLYLLDGPTGRVLGTLDLEDTIEGSPAVYADVLVIGTSSRDSLLYGIRLQ